jgi:hypothetical protein
MSETDSRTRCPGQAWSCRAGPFALLAPSLAIIMAVSICRAFELLR